MIGKISGAVAGAKAAKFSRSVKRPSGALLGTGAAVGIRRLAPLALLAAAIGGYALKRYREKEVRTPKSVSDARADPASEKLAIDETPYLISSEKVDGTDVYNRAGERLGSIHHFKVGKRDGRVHYAVMDCGELLGTGVDYYPLPWGILHYDEENGGYVVDLRKDQVNPKKVPSFVQDEDPTWDAEVRVYWRENSA